MPRSHRKCLSEPTLDTQSYSSPTTFAEVITTSTFVITGIIVLRMTDVELVLRRTARWLNIYAVLFP